ncbi:hypothetical protein ACO22_05421 [Paracoccidioides brasiliensis]|uniref:Uncharacterized protein n=1 Tax=Paracoccidioides brasiliensis TaxID=121759 RepID=A0A1D2JA90_PARBR|nr:hypothetical protein ACO22_05421 [Paracoccidioides brasiliensis]
MSMSKSKSRMGRKLSLLVDRSLQRTQRGMVYAYYPLSEYITGARGFVVPPALTFTSALTKPDLGQRKIAQVSAMATTTPKSGQRTQQPPTKPSPQSQSQHRLAPPLFLPASSLHTTATTTSTATTAKTTMAPSAATTHLPGLPRKWSKWSARNLAPPDFAPISPTKTATTTTAASPVSPSPFMRSSQHPATAAGQAQEPGPSPGPGPGPRPSLAHVHGHIHGSGYGKLDGTGAHARIASAEALWQEMQNTLAEVELSAMNGDHVFGTEHARALEELRSKQLSLAQAWSRSEVDEVVGSGTDADRDGDLDAGVGVGVGIGIGMRGEGHASGGGGGNNAGNNSNNNNSNNMEDTGKDTTTAAAGAGGTTTTTVTNAVSGTATATANTTATAMSAAAATANASTSTLADQGPQETPLLGENTERDILLARKRREANDRYFDRVNGGVLDVVAKLEEVAMTMRVVERESKEIWDESEDSGISGEGTGTGSGRGSSSGSSAASTAGGSTNNT